MVVVVKFSVFAVPSPPSPPAGERGGTGETSGGEVRAAIESGKAAEQPTYSPVTCLAPVVSGAGGAGSY